VSQRALNPVEIVVAERGRERDMRPRFSVKMKTRFAQAVFAVSLVHSVHSQAQQGSSTSNDLSCAGQTIKVISTSSHCSHFSKNFDARAGQINNSIDKFVHDICDSKYQDLIMSPTDVKELSARVNTLNARLEASSNAQIACNEWGTLSLLNQTANDAKHIDDYLIGIAQRQGGMKIRLVVLDAATTAYNTFAGASEITTIPSRYFGQAASDLGQHTVSEAAPETAGNAAPNMLAILIKQMAAP
jgi:hypothetical protein